MVPVPKGTRARDLNVVIQKKKLSVGLKGKEPIMAGELCKEVKVEESTWTLGPFPVCVVVREGLITERIDAEDQEAVHIQLEKINKQQWWENVLTHHPKIDTTKIQPENSKLSDLDGETRYDTVIYALCHKSSSDMQGNGRKDDGTFPTFEVRLDPVSLVSGRQFDNQQKVCSRAPGL